MLSGDAEISSVNETQAEEGDKDEEKKAETAKVKEAETNEKEKGDVDKDKENARIMKTKWRLQKLKTGEKRAAPKP